MDMFREIRLVLSVSANLSTCGIFLVIDFQVNVLQQDALKTTTLLFYSIAEFKYSSYSGSIYTVSFNTPFARSFSTPTPFKSEIFLILFCTFNLTLLGRGQFRIRIIYGLILLTHRLLMRQLTGLRLEPQTVHNSGV